MEDCIQQRELNEKSCATSTSAAVVASDDSVTRSREPQGARERRRTRNEQMRLHRREKNKAKRKELVNTAGIGVAPQKKRKRGLNKQEMSERVQEFETMLKGSHHTIILDASWWKIMTEKEQRSLRSQLVRCYSANVNATCPAELVVSGCSNDMLNEMWSKNRTNDFKAGWRETSKPWSLEFPRESIIYLTADAEETLEFPLSTEMVYIIGALVDRNRCKGVTLRKAKKEGVRVAKLPLQKDQLTGSRVLTVPNMVEILLGIMAGRDFDDVVKHVLPKRKQKHNSEEFNCKFQEKEEKEGVQHLKRCVSNTTLSTEGQGSQGGLIPFFNHRCIVS